MVFHDAFVEGFEVNMVYAENRTRMTKCDYVADALKDKIITGAYKPGDQLPPEGALCELFEVSRITVREALKKLSMMGIIEIKQGKGTFVTSVDLGIFMKPMSQLVNFEEIDIEAIYSAREYIESGTAHLAALRRTEQELAVLRSILKNLKMKIEVGDIVQVVHLDSAFHLAVAKASHNPILYACMESMEELDKACLKRMRQYLVILENCYEEHFKIFHAIEQQDAKAAQQAILEHTINSKRVFLNNMHNAGTQ